MPDALSAALAHAEKSRARFLEDLKSLAGIPSVSYPGFPREELDRSAEKVAELMRAAGLEGVELLSVEGSPPYAYGEWLGAEGAPTLLLYAHHDVQPPGREARWESPPFEPTLREDGRLYARGIVDDKAGVILHLGAIASWLETAGGLPVNVKLIVEGEEEVGSSHLEAFLAAYKEKLRADVIVLTDTSNFDTGHPGITTRLRGIAVCDVEVRALKAPVHSGMWGGPLPDPCVALCKILGSLLDDDGRIAIPGIYDEVRELGPGQEAALKALPFEEEAFREQAGVLRGAELVGERERGVWERLWTRPSLSVHALEASSMKGAINQVLDAAQARVSIRTVPDMDPKRALALLEKTLKERAPWGVEVEVRNAESAPWWVTEPRGKAFEAAESALEKGYGRAAAYVGCGGTIPFVGPFAKAFDGAPALLIGVEDPYCKAHSENESLDPSDLHKGILSGVHLYDALKDYKR